MSACSLNLGGNAALSSLGEAGRFIFVKGVEHTMETSLQTQWDVIVRGAEDIFPEAELRAKLERSIKEGKPLRVKLGVDPTGADLHFGHIIPVLKMKQFQDLGHHCILIIGDYTAMVGDPSGRNKTRPQLQHAEVMENCQTYQEQVFSILDPEKTEVVYNGQWFADMGFQDVLGMLSKMTVARMLEREDFAKRYQSQLPISLHELVYPLMQGYDSAMIRADVELGGTDQKFNILVGRDMQKDMGQEPQVGVCNPILLGTDGGEKMGKSLGNYIGINEAPEDMFGKTMSIPDSLMRMYFELLTEIPLTELDALEVQMQAGEVHPMDVKKRLASLVTARFHGQAGAAAGEAHFARVFSQRELPEDIAEVVLSAEQIEHGKIWIAKLLRDVGFANSSGEARRLVTQGGVRIDGETITDAGFDWPVMDGAILQVGKRRFAKIRLG